MMKMPEVRSDFYALGGGLDLLTPASALKPGFVFDSQNYEPEISGGYRRIDGYERYDGTASPTAQNYWLLGVALQGVVTAGGHITGTASGATATVLFVQPTFLVLAEVVGAFIPGESFAFSE